MGNFESLRVDVAIEDSARNGETVSALSDRVYNATEAQLIARVNQINAELDQA